MKAILLIALLLVVHVAACTPGIYGAPVREPNYYSINHDGSRSDVYSRINEWSSYGTHGLGAQAAISAAYEQAQHAPAPANTVEIWNSSLPPGVTLEQGGVKVDASAPYELVGRFEIGYWKSSAPHETAIEPDLHRLAAVTQSDTVVVEIQRVDHGDDRVDHMVGIVLKKRAVASAPPHREHVRAHLVYEATAGCPDAGEFADDVSARLGYSPWQDDAPAVHASISATRGRFHATVSRAGTAPRTLDAATCKSVTDAAVAAVVVELDDSVERVGRRTD
jgi:hypothetical protein